MELNKVNRDCLVIIAKYLSDKDLLLLQKASKAFYEVIVPRAMMFEQRFS